MLRLAILGCLVWSLMVPRQASATVAWEQDSPDHHQPTETAPATPAPSPFDATTPNLEKSSPQPVTIPHCLFCPDYGKLLVQDVRYVFNAPIRWEEKDWLAAALGGMAIVGTAILLDRPIRISMQRNRNHTTDRIANIFEPFGAQYSAGVLGGFYLAGTAFDDAEAKAVALDGLAASLIASGVITPVLKEIVGRSRPSENEGTYAFHPFGSHHSFPSGHTTQAFVVASVVSAHYAQLWVEIPAYGIAALVGFARIDHNAHFASDVLAGALIGTAVGNMVVHFNEHKRTGITIAPLAGPEVRGMALTLTF